MDDIGAKTLKIMKTASWYNNWLFSMIAPDIKGEILEIGAGVGNFTSLLAKLGNVVTIDINQEYIKKLRKLIGENAGFGDIESGKYFFKNREFDTIVCLNVLEHIKKDKQAILNMYNLLKVGGKLVLLVPAHQFNYGTLDVNLGHFKRYSKEPLKRKLKKTGFNINRVRYLNLLGAIGWFINARILKRKLLPKNQLSIFDKIARPFLVMEKVIEPAFGLSLLVIAEKI